LLTIPIMGLARRTPIPAMQGETIAIVSDGSVSRMFDVFARWRDDAAFRDFFIATLAAPPYVAFSGNAAAIQCFKVLPRIRLRRLPHRRQTLRHTIAKNSHQQ